MYILWVYIHVFHIISLHLIWCVMLLQNDKAHYVFPYVCVYMPKSDAEKVTVKGSHGDSSLQRESDSFRVKRTVP